MLLNLVWIWDFFFAIGSRSFICAPTWYLLKSVGTCEHPLHNVIFNCSVRLKPFIYSRSSVFFILVLPRETSTRHAQLCPWSHDSLWKRSQVVVVPVDASLVRRTLSDCSCSLEYVICPEHTVRWKFQLHWPDACTLRWHSWRMFKFRCSDTLFWIVLICVCKYLRVYVDGRTCMYALQLII